MDPFHDRAYSGRVFHLRHDGERRFGPLLRLHNVCKTKTTTTLTIRNPERRKRRRIHTYRCGGGRLCRPVPMSRGVFIVYFFVRWAHESGKKTRRFTRAPENSRTSGGGAYADERQSVAIDWSHIHTHTHSYLHTNTSGQNEKERKKKRHGQSARGPADDRRGYHGGGNRWELVFTGIALCAASRENVSGP